MGTALVSFNMHDQAHRTPHRPAQGRRITNVQIKRVLLNVRVKLRLIYYDKFNVLYTNNMHISERKKIVRETQTWEPNIKQIRENTMFVITSTNNSSTNNKMLCFYWYTRAYIHIGTRNIQP